MKNCIWMSIVYTFLQIQIHLACDIDTFGTHFIFGITGQYIPIDQNNSNFHVTVLSGSTANVRITAPHLEFDTLYQISGSELITLNGDVAHYESGKKMKGIEVSSDIDISIRYITVGSADWFEGMLVLPTKALGTHYYAASYRPISPFNSEIVIAAVDDDTEVVMNISLNLHGHGSTTFRLQKYETYNYKSRSELTASRISSNKPVAVISGAELVNIPPNVGDTQSLIEQMLPMKYWTKQFIVPPTYPRTHFIVKFFANQDGTVVNYHSKAGNHARHMKKGWVIGVTGTSDPMTVTANKPIMVIQYGHDGDNIAGDPFMLNVQGVSQFVSSYKFDVPSFYDNYGSHTVAISVKKADVSALQLNGVPISKWNATTLPVVRPLNAYVTMFVNVSTNLTYDLSHSGGAKFGAFLYGRPGVAAAYAYPLRLLLHDSGKNCTPVPTPTAPTLVTTTISTSQPTTISTTKPTTVSTTTSSTVVSSSPTSKPGVVKWCFKCENTTNLKACKNVQRCKPTTEICFVRRQSALNGNLYTSGCIEANQCTNSTKNGECTECCADNFCNSAGCGDQGYQDPSTRGPLCLNCSKIIDKETCHNIALCQKDQVCKIEKYDAGTNFAYNMGCTSPATCTSKRSMHSYLSRDLDVCSHCCRPDFCNLNCTTGGTDPGVIG